MKYFVLKPRAKGKDDPYARASQAAMVAYADCIHDVNPELADELLRWSTKEAVTQWRIRTFDGESNGTRSK